MRFVKKQGIMTAPSYYTFVFARRGDILLIRTALPPGVACDHSVLVRFGLCLIPATINITNVVHPGLTKQLGFRNSFSYFVVAANCLPRGR